MDMDAASMLPGWSKTGRRTRAAREVAAENLPPKKRKLDLSGRKHHTCSICSRSFSSYQALGGHNAHHNNREEQAAGVLTSGGGGVCAAMHQCTFCYKVFSKGQALGGHRRHCRQPVDGNRSKMVTFDLNELPPDEFEKENVRDNGIILDNKVDERK